MKLKKIKDKLDEDNHYVYITDNDFIEFHGNKLYCMRLWRLVLGREHGEPVFELVEEFMCARSTICEEEIEHYMSENNLTKITFTDEEFLELTGVPMGRVCFDG